ncbi:hypothetical protein BLNAU_24204 [Blattamonas nauphoetae]|uniref:Uncharacterized protein n=1 Tax=Blattamonas nauphoetae TaxID=2049346 RepID=A0ABQ9WNG1_9EUKA|nr:hypothetical protein BLNAU_24204 [Blattamonas nauphoetae]
MRMCRRGVLVPVSEKRDGALRMLSVRCDVSGQPATPSALFSPAASCSALSRHERVFQTREIVDLLVSHGVGDDRVRQDEAVLVNSQLESRWAQPLLPTLTRCFFCFNSRLVFLRSWFVLVLSSPLTLTSTLAVIVCLRVCFIFSLVPVRVA